VPFVLCLVWLMWLDDACRANEEVLLRKQMERMLSVGRPKVRKRMC
jgi:hypothetical protein